MLQSARSSNSKSFLRELENALALIEKEKDRAYFLSKFQEVFQKRHDENAIFTGEKALKSELLVYFKQLGYVRTANIWARNIPMDRKAIDELLALLQQRLLENNIQGILELHLQDREINSPHIQFVGIKAELAERIIAQTLVELKYEISLESALGKKDFIPYYEQNSKARAQKLEEKLEYLEEKKARKEILKKEREKEVDELFEEFDESLKKLKRTFDEIMLSRQDFKKRMETKFENYMQNLEKRQRKLKDIRMQMRRRKRIGRR